MLIFRCAKLVRCIAPAMALLLFTGCGLAVDSDDQLDRAETALAEGEYRAAMIDAKDVLRTEPDNVRGRLLLADASLEIGDGAAAEKELLRAIELGTSVESVAVQMARALYQQSKVQAVIDDFPADMASSVADRLAILQLRGDSYLRLNRPEAARDSFSAVLAKQPNDIDAQLGIVASYVSEKNYFQARHTLDQAMSMNPDNAQALLASGMLNLETRQFGAAESNFVGARELMVGERATATLVPVLSGLADALLAQSKLQEVREVVEEMNVVAPESIATLHMNARIAYQDGDWTSAQRDLQSILRYAPEYRPAQMLLGAVQLKSGNLAQAEMYLSAVAAASPDNRQARQLLAETRLQMARVGDAKQALQPIAASSASSDIGPVADTASADGQETITYLQQGIAADQNNHDLQFQLAIAYLNAGRVTEGRSVLQGIDVTDSEDDEYTRDALLVMARLYNGDFPAASSAAVELTEKWPESDRAQVLLGSIYMAQDNRRQARLSFENAAKKSSYDVLSRRYLAALDEAEGHHDNASEHYKKILESEPKATWAMSALARIARLDGETEQSQEWLNKIRETDPAAVNARIGLAQLYLEAKDYSAAEAVAKEAVQIDPSSAVAHNSLGVAYASREMYKNAVDSFRRATELDGESSQYRLNLAKSHRALGNTSTATDVLENDGVQKTDDISSSVLLATMKAEEGDIGGAQEVARHLQESRPDSPVPFALEAEIHVKNGDWEAASVAYDKALAISPVRLHALRAYNIKRRLQHADWDEPLLAYLKVRPVDVGVRLTLAAEYEKVSNLPMAIAEYERAIDAEPDNVVALNNLAWHYHVTGDSRAEQTARHAHDLVPENGSVADTLGWIMVQSGSTEGGVKLLRDAADLTNGRPDVRYHLAVGLAKIGQADEARTTLEEILASDAEFSNRSEAEILLGQL